MTATLIVDPDDFAGDRVVVEGDDYRHLFRARRLAVGDRIRVVDGVGSAREGQIEDVDRQRARVELGEAAPSLEPSVDVGLWVAVPKPERASWLVEKATEIGVSRLTFVEFRRSNRRLGGGSLERLRRVVRSAVGQCGRARVPGIVGPETFDDAVSRLPRGAILLDPRGGGRWPVLGPEAAVDVVIGPEGGVEDDERTSLDTAGVLPLRLGERILRIETAALVAAGILLRPPG